MVCPWLKKEENASFCTAVSPKIKLNFTKPSKSNVNGEICNMPAPSISPMVPWDKCDRYKPK
jgi:hypothetical protein